MTFESPKEGRDFSMILSNFSTGCIVCDCDWFLTELHILMYFCSKLKFVIIKKNNSSSRSLQWLCVGTLQHKNPFVANRVNRSVKPQINLRLWRWFFEILLFRIVFVSHRSCTSNIIGRKCLSIFWSLQLKHQPSQSFNLFILESGVSLRSKTLTGLQMGSNESIPWNLSKDAVNNRWDKNDITEMLDEEKVLMSLYKCLTLIGA